MVLIEFSVGNYLCFKNIVSLSTIAAGISEKKENAFLIQQPSKTRLLKSAAIYGANASGKSNLIEAFSFMRWFIINSSKETQAGEEIDVKHFRLSVEMENEPSHFEVIFIVEGERYRYGFEATRKRVTGEWLYKSLKTKEIPLFLRELDDFEIGKLFSEGKCLESSTRENALFLSLTAQLNVPISSKIVEWFLKKIRIISGLNDEFYRNVTLKLMKNDDYRKKIVNLMQKADLGIHNVEISEIDFSGDIVPEEVSEYLRKMIIRDMEGKKIPIISTQHAKYDSKGMISGFEYFDLDKNESEGTKKFFNLSGPIMDALNKGYILVVDELDARLHPVLTREIIKLFNSEKGNPRNAQLIFTTHDTSMLSVNFFRRDQIWFLEKDNADSSDLHSLVEFKIKGQKVRKDASFEKDYIKGRYGAIPFIRDFDSWVE